MNQTDTQIQEIDDATFENLIGGVDSTPNANLLETAAPEGEKPNKVSLETAQSGMDKFPDFDDEEPTEKPTKPAKPTKTEETTELPVIEDKLEGDDEPEGEETEQVQTSSVLKNIVDFYVEKGLWADFEGREDLEIDNETFQEILLEQDEYRVTQLFNELVDSTGAYGKTIISHIQKGGDPSEIVDLFTRQKKTENADTSTTEGKREFISSYYKDVHGWKDKKIQDFLDRYELENKLDDELKEVEESYEKYYKHELEKIDQQNNLKQEERKLKQEQFNKTITAQVDSRTDLSIAEKRELADSLLNFNTKLGEVNVNKFYVKFLEMQKDPAKYVQLAEFVINPDKFLKRVENKTETKVAQDKFNFIKGNKAIPKSTGSSHTPSKNKDQKQDIQFFSKNK